MDKQTDRSPLLLFIDAVIHFSLLLCGGAPPIRIVSHKIMFHRKSLTPTATSPKDVNVKDNVDVDVDVTTELQALQSWDRHEQDVRRAKAQAAWDAERNPQRTVLHTVVRTLRFVAVCAATLMATGQVVGLVGDARIDALGCIMRAYVMLLCAVAAANELEWTRTIRNSAVLHIWISRGLFYAFIGVIGLQQNDRILDMTPTSTTKALPNTTTMTPSLRFIRVVAWLMVAVGVLYATAGTVCLQFWYQRARRHYEERLQRAQQMQQWASRVVEHDIV